MHVAMPLGGPPVAGRPRRPALRAVPSARTLGWVWLALCSVIVALVGHVQVAQAQDAVLEYSCSGLCKSQVRKLTRKLLSPLAEDPNHVWLQSQFLSQVNVLEAEQRWKLIEANTKIADGTQAQRQNAFDLFQDGPDLLESQPSKAKNEPYMKAGVYADLADVAGDTSYPECQYDNMTYCLPFTAYSHSVHYQPSIFAELHLTVPRTWNEFLRVCEALKEAGYIPLGMPIGITPQSEAPATAGAQWRAEQIAITPHGEKWSFFTSQYWFTALWTRVYGDDGYVDLLSGKGFRDLAATGPGPYNTTAPDAPMTWEHPKVVAIVRLFRFMQRRGYFGTADDRSETFYDYVKTGSFAQGRVGMLLAPGWLVEPYENIDDPSLPTHLSNDESIPWTKIAGSTPRFRVPIIEPHDLLVIDILNGHLVDAAVDYDTYLASRDAKPQDTDVAAASQFPIPIVESTSSVAFSVVALAKDLTKAKRALATLTGPEAVQSNWEAGLIPPVALEKLVQTVKDPADSPFAKDRDTLLFALLSDDPIYSKQAFEYVRTQTGLPSTANFLDYVILSSASKRIAFLDAYGDAAIANMATNALTAMLSYDPPVSVTLAQENAAIRTILAPVQADAALAYWNVTPPVGVNVKYSTYLDVDLAPHASDKRKVLSSIQFEVANLAGAESDIVPAIRFSVGEDPRTARPSWWAADAVAKKAVNSTEPFGTPIESGSILQIQPWSDSSVSGNATASSSGGDASANATDLVLQPADRSGAIDIYLWASAPDLAVSHVTHFSAIVRDATSFNLQGVDQADMSLEDSAVHRWNRGFVPLNSAQGIIFMVLAALVGGLAVLTMLIFVVARNHRIVRAAHHAAMQMILGGCLLAAGVVMTLSIRPAPRHSLGHLDVATIDLTRVDVSDTTVVVCTLRMWMTLVALGLLFGAFLSKEYRVYRVLQNRYLTKHLLRKGVPGINRGTLLVLMPVIGVELLLAGLWTGLSSPRWDYSVLNLEWTCRSPSETIQTAMLSTTIAYNVLLAGLSLFVALRNRALTPPGLLDNSLQAQAGKVGRMQHLKGASAWILAWASPFQETTLIVYAVAFLTVLSVICLPLLLLTGANSSSTATTQRAAGLGTTATFTITAITYLAAALVILLIVCGPKVLALIVDARLRSRERRRQKGAGGRDDPEYRGWNKWKHMFLAFVEMASTYDAEEGGSLSERDHLVDSQGRPSQRASVSSDASGDADLYDSNNPYMLQASHILYATVLCRRARGRLPADADLTTANAPAVVPQARLNPFAMHLMARWRTQQMVVAPSVNSIAFFDAVDEDAADAAGAVRPTTGAVFFSAPLRGSLLTAIQMGGGEMMLAPLWGTGTGTGSASRHSVSTTSTTSVYWTATLLTPVGSLTMQSATRTPFDDLAVLLRDANNDAARSAVHPNRQLAVPQHQITQNAQAAAGVWERAGTRAGMHLGIAVSDVASAPPGYAAWSRSSGVAGSRRVRISTGTGSRAAPTLSNIITPPSLQGAYSNLPMLPTQTRLGEWSTAPSIPEIATLQPMGSSLSFSDTGIGLASPYTGNSELQSDSDSVMSSHTVDMNGAYGPGVDAAAVYGGPTPPPPVSSRQDSSGAAMAQVMAAPTPHRAAPSPTFRPLVPSVADSALGYPRISAAPTEYQKYLSSTTGNRSSASSASSYGSLGSMSPPSPTALSPHNGQAHGQPAPTQRLSGSQASPLLRAALMRDRHMSRETAASSAASSAGSPLAQSHPGPASSDSDSSDTHGSPHGSPTSQG
ncbi:hypothetical protein CXG81DRAFT_18430 [Caulochytrium protostelioides]|uniref:G-protein coupled receptors family 3 profile domain-containing protein n=1 Tax=Caulochytrium protostelioides TaxID=1555241 RepID=A0A4V1IUU7_9FUNG|nr:hypothetical protein CXG81DRAFT_18430 [Caulochytrium protostelioides]|eukprot:RKP01799.1 hypothetical protein CXG81DRAFT_18430 [Caulochytrium protostelioides]